MKETAELLSSPRNYAVVQLPKRQYPGIVVQGDSLYNIISTIEKSCYMIDKEPNNAKILLRDLKDSLSEVIDFYIKICLENNITLPFKF